MIGSKELFEQEQLLNYLDEVAEGVEAGRNHALQEWYMLGQIEKKAKEVKTLIKPRVIHETDGEAKNFERHGLKIERRSGTTRLVYKGIEEWERAEAEKKKIEQKYKAAYQSYQKGITPVDEETGEVLDIPATTSSEDSVIVKLAK